MGLASSKAANSIAASSNGNGVGSKCVDNVIIGTHHHHPDIQQPCSLLPSPSSGISVGSGGGIDTWKTAAPPSSCHVRQASIRSRNLQPMPDIGELDRRFAKVLHCKKGSNQVFALVAKANTDRQVLCGARGGTDRELSHAGRSRPHHHYGRGFCWLARRTT